MMQENHLNELVATLEETMAPTPHMSEKEKERKENVSTKG